MGILKGYRSRGFSFKSTVKVMGNKGVKKKKVVKDSNRGGSADQGIFRHLPKLLDKVEEGNIKTIYIIPSVIYFKILTTQYIYSQIFLKITTRWLRGKLT